MNANEIKNIIKEKVAGKIIPQHTDEEHRYEFVETGKIVKSVTTKLIIREEHLIPWAVQQGIEWLEGGDRWQQLKNPENRETYMRGAKFAFTATRDDAGNVGTVAHDAAESYTNYWINNGRKPEDIRDFFGDQADARSIAAARSVEKLFKEYECLPIAAELLVGSERFNSAGTLDKLILNPQGELELWDYKTSNQINKVKYPMQVAAYAKFFEEMSGLKIARAKIIHLSKDMDSYKVYRVKNLVSAFRAYKNISAVYDWIYNNREKVELDIKKIKI